MNLMAGLLEELNRNRELLTVYKEIGPAGMFGAAMITQDIEAAEKAIGSRDVVEMIVHYEKLKDNE